MKSCAAGCSECRCHRNSKNRDLTGKTDTNIYNSRWLYMSSICLNETKGLVIFFSNMLFVKCQKQETLYTGFSNNQQIASDIMAI